MARDFFKNLPNTTTPLTAPRLNGLLDGDEPMGNVVVDSIRSKNMWQNVLNNIIKSGTSSLTLNKDTYIFVASGVDMYFGQVANTGNTYDNTRGILYKVKPNTTYSLSLSNSSFNKNLITSYNSSKVSLGYSTYTSNVITFTTANNCEYITIRIGINPATTGTTYTTTVQLEEGSTATTYSPYQDLNNNVSTGQVNLNISTTAVEINSYARSGKVASLKLTITIQNQVSANATTQIGTNLPKPNSIFGPNGWEFFGVSKSDKSNIRCRIDEGGVLTFWYLNNQIPAGTQLYFFTTYITED